MNCHKKTNIYKCRALITGQSVQSEDKALFTNDVYKPYHHPILQIMMLVDGTVQGVLQSMIVDENL